MLNRNLVTVIVIWIISVLAAIGLFLIVDATLAAGEFLGFKVAGGLAGAIVVFILLFRSYTSLGRSDLQVYFVFDEKPPKSIEKAKITYQFTKSYSTSKAKPAQLIEQFGQKYILIPDISFEDYIQIRIEADDGIWISDNFTSRVRHLKFKRLRE